MPDGRTILFPETGAPKGSLRRVIITLPENPQVGLAVGPYIALEGDINGIDNAGATPQDIADTRVYQWPEPDAGRDYEINLLPHQWIAAISHEGIAKVTMLVEYY